MNAHAHALKNGKVLLTGASGFVGGAILRELSAHGIAVNAAFRECPPSGLGEAIHPVQIEAIGPFTDWSDALEDCRYVVHAAALAHVPRPDVSALAEFRNCNVLGTIKLAEEAGKRNVERFVFVSSIGVNGASGSGSFTERDSPAPAEPYAESKWEAERLLKDVCRKYAMEFVIVRPPLVYGPNCKGNFLEVLRLAYSAMPLPFAGLRQPRSLINIWNLGDFLMSCLTHPNAANETFVICDGEDTTPAHLFECLRRAWGRPPRLFYFPAFLLSIAASCLNRRTAFKKLAAALRVDAAFARDRLDWQPAVSLTEGLARTARWYADTTRK